MLNFSYMFCDLLFAGEDEVIEFGIAVDHTLGQGVWERQAGRGGDDLLAEGIGLTVSRMLAMLGERPTEIFEMLGSVVDADPLAAKVML